MLPFKPIILSLLWASLELTGWGQSRPYKPGMISLVLVDPYGSLTARMSKAASSGDQKLTGPAAWRKLCKIFAHNFYWKQDNQIQSFFDGFECGGIYKTLDAAQKSLKPDRNWILTIQSEDQERDDISIWRRTPQKDFNLEARVKGRPKASQIEMLFDRVDEQWTLVMQLMRQLPCLWMVNNKRQLSEIPVPLKHSDRFEIYPEETFLYEIILNKNQSVWEADYYYVGMYQRENKPPSYALNDLSITQRRLYLCVADTKGRDSVDASEWSTSAPKSEDVQLQSLAHVSGTSFHIEFPVGSSSGIDILAPATRLEHAFGKTRLFDNFRLRLLNRAPINRINELGSYYFQEQRLELAPEWTIPPLGLGAAFIIEIGIRPTVGGIRFNAGQTLEREDGSGVYTIDFQPQPGLLLGFDGLLYIQKKGIDLDISCGVRYYGMLPKYKDSWVITGFGCNSQMTFAYSEKVDFPLSFSIVEYNLRKSSSSLSYITDDEETTLQNINYIISWLGVGVKYKW